MQFLNDRLIHQRTQIMQASPPLNGSKRIKFRLQSPDLRCCGKAFEVYVINAQKPANTADIKQFCIEEWTKIPSWQGKTQITSYQTSADVDR